MSKTYAAAAKREDGWWMVRVPEVNGLTNCRRLAQAETMAKELVAVSLDLEVEDVQVDLEIEAVEGVEVKSIVEEVLTKRIEAALLESEATETARRLARTLSEADVPLRDIGTILGVSHQRAHQLVAA